MRVVVVEDEMPIREGMAKLLHQINPNYALIGKAEDGLSGYELVVEKKPDLVIMDIRMPGMDGLAMLKKLNEAGINCKAIVLTAHSEFDYAKQAIELGVLSYLLKPLKLPELKRALEHADQMIRNEQSREAVLSLENIFLSCVHGQLEPDEIFHVKTQEKYGFTVLEPAEIFLVWLGERYETHKKMAIELLERVAGHTVKYSAYIKDSDNWKAVMMILYRQQGGSQKEYYEKSVVPVMHNRMDNAGVFVWRKIDHLIDISKILGELKEELQWALYFPKGELIEKSKIDKLSVIPIKYPLELEDRTKNALKKEDWTEVVRCYEKLFEFLRREPYLPSQIKECLICFSWNLIGVNSEIRAESELRIQHILQRIHFAYTWEQIRIFMQEYMSVVKSSLSRQEDYEETSELVQKAKEMIRKYYSQGLTLEQTAERLFVSEEYLSSQFKRETGKTFTETVRKYRIKKVKELLSETHLKLNQIAELSGYSDPKYMSRVFKEEVGMLPTEYRKSIH